MAIAAVQRAVARFARSPEVPADDVLLCRFAQRRDEAAFAELVRRHGAMVQGVARRALGDRHAAEDVVQATFLLLARKARHVRWQPAIGPWLYSAAFRLAQEAVRRRSRYPTSLGAPPELPARGNSPEQPLLWQEVQSVLDEELARLPEALRAPLVLCYLQGLTRDEAAPRLGLTVATLKRRLEKGRERLRGRLMRRGLSLAALAGWLAENEDVSAATVDAAVDAACAGRVSPAVAALLSTKTGRSQKILAIALLITVGVGGTWLTAFRPVHGGQPADPPAAPKPAVVEKTDLLGDALPDGAVVRLGTARFRPGGKIQQMAFSPDGKRLAVWAKAWASAGRDRLIIADAVSGRELRTIVVPPCLVLTLRWLADGRGLAVVKYSGADCYVWEFTDENARLPERAKTEFYSVRNGDLRTAAISLDGKYVATGRTSLDGGAQPVELWDVTPNAELAPERSRKIGQIDGHGHMVRFSDDGKRVFVVNQKQGPIWAGPAAGPKMPAPIVGGQPVEQARMGVFETATGRRLSEYGVAAPLTMAFSPDSKTVYLGGQAGNIRAYDWAASKETAVISAHADSDSTGMRSPGVTGLALSPDGRTLYSAGRRDGMVVWDVQTGKQRREVRDRLDGLDQIVVSPDGTRLAAAAPYVVGDVHILDAATGAEPPAGPGHGGMLLGLALRPDGTAVTAGLDRAVREWDLATGRELRHWDVDILHTWMVTCPVVADGRGVFLYDNRQPVYVDLASGKRTRVTEEIVDPINVIHGVAGSTVFVSTKDRKVRQWDAVTGRTLQTFDPPPPRDGRPIRVAAATMSPDRTQVCIISQGTTSLGPFGGFNCGQISLYDSQTGALKKRWETGEAVFDSAAYSPDGRYLIAAGTPVMTQPLAPPPDTALPISARSALLLLDARSGEPIRTFEPGFKSNGYYRATALAFSPNSTVLAAAQNDGSICVYELATGNIVRAFRGHRHEVPQLAFTHDGRRLVSVSYDMTGLVWDVSFAALARPSSAVPDKLWTDLAKPEWELAGPALAALANRPDEFLKLVRDRLPAATGPDFDPAAVTKLVAQLGDATFAGRERASAALARHGREVLPLLQNELTRTTSAEQRRRLQAAIDAITRSPVPSDRLRQVRVLALMEQQKSDGARAELKRLSAGHASAALTRDAKMALDR